MGGWKTVDFASPLHQTYTLARLHGFPSPLPFGILRILPVRQGWLSGLKVAGKEGEKLSFCSPYRARNAAGIPDLG